jgi:hypothetical protein
MAATRELSARPLLWVLIVLCGVSFAALAPHLLYPDLNLDYPFVDGDSHDWIANGLFFTGADVRYSGRAPLLPLALAALDTLGLLPWWPLLGLLLFLATVVGFYTLAETLFPPAAAFAAALLLLLGYSLQGLAVNVMADVPASCLMLWSLRAFLTARCAPAVGAAEARRYAWSGLLAGLAGLTQMIGLAVPLAGALTLAARRRRDLACPWPWLGAFLALACEGAWILVRRFAFAARGDTLESKGILVGFHLSSLRYCLWSLLSLLGLPACLLLAAGIGLAAARACRRQAPSAIHPEPARPAAVGGAVAGSASRRGFDAAAALMILLLFAGTCGFFAFLWRYNAKRFLVFAAWPAALLIAAALAPLARSRRPAGRLAFAAAAVLAVAGAALPLPEPAYDPTWAALWPLPPLAAHVAVQSGSVPDDSAAPAQTSASPPLPPPPPPRASLAISRLPARSLAAWSLWGRAAGAWAARPRQESRPDPARFAAAQAALFLYDRGDDGGGRYRTITRLSAALRKPVRFVPRSSFARYWGLVRLAPALRLSPDYLIYPAEIQGLAGSWLLATPGDKPLAAGSPELLQPAQPPLAPEDPVRAAAEARAIAALAGSANAYVALFWRPRAGGLVQIFLPFLLQTTDLYIVEPSESPATRALFAHSPIESERRVAGARVTETRLRGRRTALITTAPVIRPAGLAGRGR